MKSSFSFLAIILLSLNLACGKATKAGDEGQTGGDGNEKEHSHSEAEFLFELASGAESRALSEDQKSQCAEQTGLTVEDVIEADFAGEALLEGEVEEGKVLAISAEGNSASLVLSVVDGTLEGLCIFVDGNDAATELNVSGHIEGLFYSADGNQGSLSVEVNAGGDIHDFNLAVSGNQNSIAVSGEGEYSCPEDSPDYDLVCTPSE